MRAAKFAPLLSACLPILLAAQTPEADLRHAKALLHSSLLVDGHNDLPWVIRESGKPPMDVEAYDLRHKTSGDTDLARLRAGGVGAQFWSVYVPGEITTGYAKTQLEQLDIARRMVAKYPEALQLALTATDIERARRHHRIASLLGMEGGHVLENSLGALRAYYDLGARYMTLTHNVTLDWADAALGTPRHHGLTPFGKAVVHEMNRLGMMVDLSHVSPDVMRDALDATEAPVIFSHSCARAIVDHPRNVPDEILKRLPRNGGLVMVTFIPSFVSKAVMDWDAPMNKSLAGLAIGSSEFEARKQAYLATHGPSPRATIRQVADHIDHMREVAGIDHVGIAGDYYGDPAGTVQGLEDVSCYPSLFAELIHRGWRDPDLRKLAGGNLLRVMRQVEASARRIQLERKPSIATIQELDGAKKD